MASEARLRGLFLRLLHIVQERLYLIDLVLRHGAARLVDPAQLGGVALHSADLQRDGRADDIVFAGGLLHGDVGEGLVVPLVTVGHRCHEGRIAQIPRTDGRQHGILLFHEALGLGHDDEVPLVTQALEEADGDGVGHAAVQQGVVADPDGLRRQRHGRRSLHPAHVLGVAAAALVVDGVAGVQVGADDKEVHGRSAEGLFIEGVQLFRHLVVAEILAVEVAGAQQIAEAGVALVVAIFGVVADDSRKKRKKVIDKMAAVVILEGYLQHLSFKNRG